jgi:cytochrome c-type biogenesis protein CcmH/NrfF
MKILRLFLILMFISLAFGEDYEFFNQKLTPEQKEDAIYLEKNLMATCCFGGPVYMHGKNQKTEEAKVTIRKLLIEGKSKDEILDYFRNTIDPRTGQKYGNRILASPKASETVGKVSYWSVVGFAVLGLILLALAIRKFLGNKTAEQNTAAVSDSVLKKIESDLDKQDNSIG